MTLAKFVRKTHRWSGLIIGIQLLIWTASGFYFSLIPIEQIHGDHLALPAADFAFDTIEDFRAPGLAVNGFMSANPAAQVDGISLQNLRGRAVYKIRASINKKPVNRLVDARTGEPLPMIDNKEAELIGEHLIRFDAPLESIDLIESSPIDSEFRGRVLPLYRLTYDHNSGIHLYLDAWTGELVARRTSYWRGFDFLWMLHIMDYDARDNINNNFLRVFAFAGLLFVLSGFWLWLISSRWMRQRRTKKPISGQG